MQIGHAMRVAKLRDIEATKGMSVNTSFSVLHFFEDKIVSNADTIWTSLWANSREVAKSVNDLLDLEAGRAIEML